MQKLAIYILPLLVALGALFLSLENAIGVTLAFLMVLYFWLTRKKFGNSILWILIGGFILRVITALIDQNLHVFPYVWDLYFPIASQLYENIKLGYPYLNNVHDSLNVLSYASLATFFYAFLGKHQLIIRIFNAFWGVLAVDRTYRLSKVLFKNEKFALLSALFVSFFPSFIIFSSLDMRDAIILFLSTDFLWRVCETFYLKKKRWLFVVFDVVFLSVLRVQNMILLIGIFVSFLVIWGFLKVNPRYRFYYSSLILMLAIVSVFALQKVGILDFIFTYMKHDLITRSAGGSVYLAGKFYNTWADIIVWAPLRFIHFTFGPFVWSAKNFFIIIGTVEAFVITICFLVFVVNWKSFDFKKNSFLVFLVWVMFLGLLGNALVDSNYGTAIRHRMNYILILFILATPFLTSIKIRLFKH